MKIVLLGGVKRAKYLIEKFNNKKNKLVYITKDANYGQAINKEFGIDVFIGDGTSPMILESAGISNFDLMITMFHKDEENLVACRLGKFMKIKRTLSVINFPHNEEIFRELGIDTTISIAYIIGMIIEKNAFTENVETLLPIEDGKAVILEAVIEKNFKSVNKKVSELNIPKEAVIGCIVRNDDAVIPRGDTVIMENDRLVIIALDEVRHKVIKAVTEIE